MHLIRYDDPQRFYDAALPSLIQQEAHNNVILGIAGQLARSGIGGMWRTPYLALIEEQGQAIAAGLLIPGRDLVLAKSENNEASRLLAEDLHDAFPMLPGVNGVVSTVDTFAPIWTEISGQAHTLDMKQRLYQMENVKPVENVTGTLIRARQEYRDLVVEWMRGFIEDALTPTSLSAVEEMVDRRLADDNSALYLWCDPEPVSMAGIAGPTPNGIRINAVYTPPELRRRGYASAITAALSQAMLDQGRIFCFLYTDLDNPTSNHIYQTIGYAPVCDVNVYKFADDIE